MRKKRILMLVAFFFLFSCVAFADINVEGFQNAFKNNGDGLIAGTVNGIFTGMIIMFRGVSTKASRLFGVTMCLLLIISMLKTYIENQNALDVDGMIKAMMPDMVKGIIFITIFTVAFKYPANFNQKFLGAETNSMADSFGTAFTFFVETITGLCYKLGLLFMPENLSSLNPGELAQATLTYPLKLLGSIFNFKTLINLPEMIVKAVLLLFCLWEGAKLVGTFIANIFTALMINTFSLFYMIWYVNKGTSSLGQKGITNVLTQAITIFITSALMGVTYTIMNEISTTDGLSTIIAIALGLMILANTTNNAESIASAILAGNGLGQSQNGILSSFGGVVATAFGTAFATGVDGANDAVNSFKEGYKEGTQGGGSAGGKDDKATKDTKLEGKTAGTTDKDEKGSKGGVLDGIKGGFKKLFKDSSIGQKLDSGRRFFDEQKIKQDRIKSLKAQGLSDKEAKNIANIEVKKLKEIGNLQKDIEILEKNKHRAENENGVSMTAKILMAAALGSLGGDGAGKMISATVERDRNRKDYTSLEDYYRELNQVTSDYEKTVAMHNENYGISLEGTKFGEIQEGVSNSKFDNYRASDVGVFDFTNARGIETPNYGKQSERDYYRTGDDNSSYGTHNTHNRDDNTLHRDAMPVGGSYGSTYTPNGGTQGIHEMPSNGTNNVDVKPTETVLNTGSGKTNIEIKHNEGENTTSTFTGTHQNPLSSGTINTFSVNNINPYKNIDKNKFSGTRKKDDEEEKS